MSSAPTHEVISELFLTSNGSHLINQQSAAMALGGAEAEAEEIILQNKMVPMDVMGGDKAIPSTPVPVPDMWSWPYIGLYCQYAAVGLLYGSTGTLLPFCVYTYDGPSNVCANARNIVTFAWSFKIWFAMLTDSYRPWGLRRKPYMLMGWAFVLIMLLVLACAAESMDVTTWLVCLLFTQCFLMLSDVPADGYSVELGQLESIEQRGQILATGQRIRFSFCVVAGVIQTFLLNGKSTNDADCAINFQNCWGWGLSVNQYYAVLFVLVFLLTIPILWLKELDNSRIPVHTWDHYLSGIWNTMQNLTTFYLLIFVIGSCALTNFTNNAAITLQYYVIKLTNFQAGIDTITTYGGLVIGIWIFQTYFINSNWRYTQYASSMLSIIVGIVWIAPFYDAGGTMNPWFTIFIDLDTYFVQGLAQVLYSMAVIELAIPGQEATTYELVVTVGNAALTLNGVISTQLLTPVDATSCGDDDCDADTVDVSSVDAFNDSNGPARFTAYTLVLTAISLVSLAFFTQFLPASKAECQVWKEEGQRLGTSVQRGRVALFMSAVIIMVGACTLLLQPLTCVQYGIIAAILLLDVNTACQPAVGGSGC